MTLHSLLKGLAGASLFLWSTGSSQAADGSLKGQSFFIPGVEEYRLLVKFSAAAGPDIGEDGGLILRNPGSAAFAPGRSGAGLRFRRAVPFSAEESRELRQANPRPLRNPA